MEFINLTPHTITVRVATEIGDRTFPASGGIARVEVQMGELSFVDGIPCATRKCGKVTGLPDVAAPETYYLVSTMVMDAFAAEVMSAFLDMQETGSSYRFDRLQALQGRLLVPDSGPDAIRENGQIVAIRRFIRA